MDESLKELSQTVRNTAVHDIRRENVIKVKPETSSEHTETTTSTDNSEYDSAGSYSDEEPGRVRSRNCERESGDNSDSGTEASVTLEREEGDGQESVPLKKVDDDEDKKNPQYIPKRGTFYEHDDRTADDVEGTEITDADKSDKDNKKKVWQDKKEKWTHDRFNDCEQAPKSRAELIQIYGYDIRNEDGPPRARRRRRYGRGPNKYTRKWEDEDAYNKPPPVSTRPVKKTERPARKARNQEEYPALGQADPKQNDRQEENYENGNTREERSYKQAVVREEINKQEHPVSSPIIEKPPVENNRVQQQQPDHSFQQPPLNNRHDQQLQPQQQQQQRVGTGRIIKPKKEIKDSDYRGFTTKTRQVRNMKKEPKVIPHRNLQKKEDVVIHTQNFTNRSNNTGVQELEHEMGKMNMQDNYSVKTGGGGSKQYNNQRQGSVPPRLQNEQKGSKRYSSMRQRSLPETNAPPNYPTSYYPNEYNQQAPPEGPQQPLLHQPPPQIHPAATQIPQLGPAPLPPLPQQVPVTAAPLLQPAFPSPFPQPPPAFLQAGVAPPQFIQPQPAQIINYVQNQPPFPPPPAFQGYQQQFTAVTQPTELYQPQGGITYYSTDQQLAQRCVPVKRPKAAIPIVAPPSYDYKSRDKKEDEATSQTSPLVVPDSNDNLVIEEPMLAVEH